MVSVKDAAVFLYLQVSPVGEFSVTLRDTLKLFFSMVREGREEDFFNCYL